MMNAIDMEPTESDYKVMRCVYLLGQGADPRHIRDLLMTKYRLTWWQAYQAVQGAMQRGWVSLQDDLESAG